MQLHRSCSLLGLKAQLDPHIKIGESISPRQEMSLWAGCFVRTENQVSLRYEVLSGGIGLQNTDSDADTFQMLHRGRTH